MNTEIYLTQEELEKIKAINSRLAKAKMAIADIEIEKSQILREIDSMYFEISSHEKSLIEKYGEDMVVNIQTGQVTKKEAKPKMEMFKN
jgi:uncharacterized protein with gpF-like domain